MEEAKYAALLNKQVDILGANKRKTKSVMPTALRIT